MKTVSIKNPGFAVTGPVRVVTNPQTGAMETVACEPDTALEQLQKTRRELREMISGNTQFHQDDLGPAVTEAKKPPHDPSRCKCYWGAPPCAYCVSDEYDPESV